MFNLIILEGVVILVYMTGWFLVATVLRRNDVADIAWGVGFIVAASSALAVSGEITLRGVLVMVLVLIWGVRLSLHISLRNRGKPEDARYRKWREEWGRYAAIRAFLQVFMLQGCLLLIISLPVITAIAYGKKPLNLLDVIGIFLWLIGFLFEGIGDYQLTRFKRNPDNRGRIMTQGLWRYTRHPNYFGEVLLWWGMYVIALSAPRGWATIIGPLTITLLILKVSGIPLLERKYQHDEAFQNYKRRTSAFFPLPPGKEK